MKTSMSDNRKKILIIGENSYLATGLSFDAACFDVTKIKRPFEGSDKNNYRLFDYVINFCIQPEHFTRNLDEAEMIDIEIAKAIEKSGTKQVFLSSRKVYGSSYSLKEYFETDELKPYDYYSQNKCAIENKLNEINSENTLILRTGNIIGELTTKKNYKTFIGWIEQELEKNGKVLCTVLEDTKKDFITKYHFQKVLKSAIENNLTGVYNIGAGFALPIKEILLMILPENLVDFSFAVNKSEQFILNTNKISNKLYPYSVSSFKDEVKHLNIDKLSICV